MQKLGRTAVVISVALLAAVLAAVPAAAQALLHKALGAPDNLIITGLFRSRFDAIDGQFRPEPFEASGAMVSLRFVLFAEYDTGPVRIGAEFNDSRAYLEGDRSSVSNAEVNVFNLTQVYLGFDLDDALGEGTTSTLAVGRITMDFGSRRLIGRNQFRNTVNTFTGARFDWRGAGTAAGADVATLFWTMPVTRLPRDPRRVADNEFEADAQVLNTQFFGASYTKAGLLGGTAQLFTLALLENDAEDLETLDRHLLTTGLRLLRPPGRGRFDHDVEVVYQFGTRGSLIPSNAPRQDVSAWFFHLESGYTFAAAWLPRVVLQLDYATGDRDDPNSFNGFDTLFGVRRGEYGPASLYGPLGRTNIISPALRLEATPSPRWDGFLVWRPLWLESATAVFAFTGVRDPSGAAGSWAGHQIEGRVRYWLVPDLIRLDGGLAYLAKSDFFRLAPNGRDDGNTRYGYLDISFLF